MISGLARMTEAVLDRPAAGAGVIIKLWVMMEVLYYDASAVTIFACAVCDSQGRSDIQSACKTYTRMRSYRRTGVDSIPGHRSLPEFAGPRMLFRGRASLGLQYTGKITFLRTQQVSVVLAR